MQLEPYSSLSWAYQLHYYFCFRTYRRRAFFAEESQKVLLETSLQEICERHNYHPLQSKIYPDHLRLLLSLRPEQTIGQVVNTVKTNLSRHYGAQFKSESAVWARGYLARSVGRVRLGAVRRYLNIQADHHGYAKRARPPVLRYRSQSRVELTGAHTIFDLNHHLVFAVRHRAGVFDSQMGEAICHYWLKVAARDGFAIDQVSLLPDHVHLIVRTRPMLNVQVCALSLLNNGQHFIGKHFAPALVAAGVDRLWQPSGYVGACGNVTTAQVKSFLSSGE